MGLCRQMEMASSYQGKDGCARMMGRSGKSTATSSMGMGLLYFRWTPPPPGMPQYIWDEFDRLAIETIGSRIPTLAGLGATETAPFVLCAEKENRRSGVIGLPVPGVELKLARVNGKLEARVRGPNVTPGFLGNQNLTRATFDDEGYYRMGDAVAFIDPKDPNRGFLFDGRLAEDFKLSTGTWVSVGPIRTMLIPHGEPLVKDAVIAGQDRDEVTALIFPIRRNWRSWRRRAKRKPRSKPCSAISCDPARTVRTGLCVRLCCASRRRSMRARSRTKEPSTRQRCSNVAPAW